MRVIPGRYYAIALADVDQSEWNTPDFRTTLRDRAVALSIDEGESKGPRPGPGPVMDVFGDVRMSRQMIALLALPVSLFAGATGAAQTAEPSTKAAATAILRGRVVAADSGQPLRRAQIHIMAMAGRFPRTTTTDASGRYEFTELPGALYTVMASKGSYVQLSYGQTR